MTELEEVKHVGIVLNGAYQKIDTTNLTPETTLNEYLRDYLHLTGTKYMCREGGCGTCIVSITGKNARTGSKETIAVNSCLVSIFSCGGWEINTVESLGNRHDGYHKIQERLVQFNGTQCGFCTPGMVMNMHALMESGKFTMAEIENSFGGNICRCTGYRPILTAFKSLASDSDEKILGLIPDIEDMKLCRKEKCKETCPTPCAPATPFVLANLGPLGLPAKNWYKANSITDIFSIMKDPKNAAKDVKLVAGNTARGVFYDMDTADYYIDVRDIQELRNYSLGSSCLNLGGNVTITDAMEIFATVAKSDFGFRHLATVVTHLDLVATVPIRNIGTFAGNLSMKHKHNEFQSDVFLLLEGINAKLILDNGKARESVTPAQYLSRSMQHKIIRNIEIPSLDESYRFGSYKIMPRAQNAHAMLNAVFLFKLNANNIVQSATIAYGAINPEFIHAANAEEYIKGKQLFDNANLQNLFDRLNKELNPDHILPDPSPEYRKQLAIALCYKFILSITPKNVLSGKNQSGGEKLVRPPVSKGTQDYKTNESMYPIGKPVNKVEAYQQVSGEAKYIIDMQNQPGQLFAAFVMSAAPAGSKVVSVDAKEALQLRGVEAFLSAKDIADLHGENNFTPASTAIPTNEKIFVEDTVEYFFQPIGIIVANSQKLAEKAVDLVKVVFVPPTKSPILNVRDALKFDTSRITELHTFTPSKESSGTIKVSGEFEMTWQYHYHMENQIANVVADDDGGYIVHPSTQWIDLIQSGITGSLNIPANKVKVEVKRVGGSYGAKISRNNMLTCAAVLACIKTQKPIKFWLPLITNMNVMGKRNPAYGLYEAESDNNGLITKLHYNFSTDYGLVPIDNPAEPLESAFINATYDSSVFYFAYTGVWTDNATASYCRAPGTVEGLTALEIVMEQIAYKCDKDPVDVRLANLNKKNHPLLGTVYNDILEWSDYRKRKTEIDNFNKSNRWRKRGITAVPMILKVIFFGNYTAQVSVYHADGTVAIKHGGIEIGQGVNTKAVQVVAYELGIDVSMVNVHASNSFATPNNTVTGGSTCSEGFCMALSEACKKLKKRMDENKDDKTEWKDIVNACYAKNIQLTEAASFNPTAAENNPFKEYFVYGACVSEIEIDLLTGNHIIQRVDLIEDVGDTMSPMIDIGQCEGAFVMGLGYFTTEEIIMDKDGELKTNRTWNYKPPGAKDIPVDFRVKFPSGIPNPASPFKTKATGEPPLAMANSVALAIRYALKSARNDADPSLDPWVPMNGPTTAEFAFLNAHNDFKQYKL